MPPPDATASLRAGAEELGCPISAEQATALLRYLALLQQWNRVYNLTAIRDEARMSILHLLDSLSIVPLLDRRAEGRPLHVLDVGSGGGLPGIVIAIARPAWTVTCVDAVLKKVRFIQQAALQIPVPGLQAVHTRIECWQTTRKADVIVSRAFANLADFCTWTRPHLQADGAWLAMKGRVPEAEFGALPPDVEVFHVEHLRVPGLDAERCAIWIRPRH